MYQPKIQVIITRSEKSPKVIVIGNIKITVTPFIYDDNNNFDPNVGI